MAALTKVSKIMMLRRTTKELRRTKEHMKVKDPKITTDLMSSNMRNLRIMLKESAINGKSLLIYKYSIKLISSNLGYTLTTMKRRRTLETSQTKERSRSKTTKTTSKMFSRMQFKMTSHKASTLLTRLTRMTLKRQIQIKFTTQSK